MKNLKFQHMTDEAGFRMASKIYYTPIVGEWLSIRSLAKHCWSCYLYDVGIGSCGPSLYPASIYRAACAVLVFLGDTLTQGSGLAPFLGWHEAHLLRRSLWDRNHVVAVKLETDVIDMGWGGIMKCISDSSNRWISHGFFTLWLWAPVLYMLCIASWHNSRYSILIHRS